MARGKRRDLSNDSKDTTAKETEEPQQQGGVTPEFLNTFAGEVASLKSDSDEIRSEIGQKFKEFEEKGGHKAAFKFTAKLKSLPTDKAKDMWLSALTYMRQLGVFKQHDLLDPQIAELDEQVETAATKSAPPVPPLPRGASTH